MAKNKNIPPAFSEIRKVLKNLLSDFKEEVKHSSEWKMGEAGSWTDNIKASEKLLKNLKKFKNEGTLYARKCDATGEGMNEGWMIGDSYFKYKKDADKHARTMSNEENPDKGNYKNFKELYNSMDEDNNDFCYWTQWEMPTDAQYIVKNGKLTKI